MVKIFAKLIPVIATITIMLIACSGTLVCHAEQLPEYTIRAVLPGNTPNHFDEVLASAEDQLKDTLNVKLDFQFIPWSDYRNKINVMMAAGDDFDLHLNAQWLSIFNMIADEVIQPWDDLLAEYGQDLLNSIPGPMLEANKFHGKLYGIPNGNVYGRVMGWVIRKDLREKYGMPKPTTIEELEQFLMNVKEHEQGMIPVTWQGGSFTPNEALFPLELGVRGIKVGSVEFFIYVHPDGTIEPVQGIFDDPHSLEAIKTFRRWYVNGLIEKDVMTQEDAIGALTSGRVAAKRMDITRMHQDQAVLASNIPGAELEFLKVGWGEQKLTSDFQMWNFVVLNSKCKDPVRVTQFMNWLFSDHAHYDLLAYGIEGKHWVDTENGTYGIPEGVDATTNYNFPGYVLLWKPGFDRILAEASEEEKAWTQFLKDDKNMVPSALIGLTVDTSGLKNELAKCNAIWPSVARPIMNGIVDPETEIPNAKKKLAAAGYDKIVEEINRQIEEFKASKGLK